MMRSVLDFNPMRRFAAHVSKGLMKMPSGRPRRSRSRLALRIDNGRSHLAPTANTSKAQRIEIGDTVDAQDDGLAIDNGLLASVPQL
jgi:hypothetical protein